MDYHRHDRRGSDRVKGEKDTELQQIIEAATQNGFPMVLSCLFLWQWVKSQDRSDKREEKLYSVIDTLSAELPPIKDRLGRIESDVHDIVKEVNR